MGTSAAGTESCSRKSMRRRAVMGISATLEGTGLCLRVMGTRATRMFFPWGQAEREASQGASHPELRPSYRAVLCVLGKSPVVSVP